MKAESLDLCCLSGAVQFIHCIRIPLLLTETVLPTKYYSRLKNKTNKQAKAIMRGGQSNVCSDILRDWIYLETTYLAKRHCESTSSVPRPPCRWRMELVKVTDAPGHRLRWLTKFLSLHISENRLNKYPLAVFYILLIFSWSSGMEYVLHVFLFYHYLLDSVLSHA